MDSKTQTPLGELLVTWRTQLGISQKELAHRTTEVARHDDAAGPVSLRTIVSLEQPTAASKLPRRPHHATAHSLAIALELQAGSPAYRAFMAAAVRPPAAPAPLNGHREDRASTVIEAGREQPLHRLAQMLDAAADGTPQAIVVRGEYGTGKSTIIAHACRLALDRHPDATVLWAQAHPNDPSHGAFKRIIRQMLGEVDATALSTTLPPSLLQSAMPRVDIAANSLAAEGPLLASVTLTAEDRNHPIFTRVSDPQATERLAHLAETPPDDAMRAVSGCEQFFRVARRYASAGPVILVIDDLHAADAATLASLDHLVNRIHQRHDLPLAVVVACPPDRQLEGAPAGLGDLLETVQRLFPHGPVDLASTLTSNAARAFANATLDRASLPCDPDTVDALLARTGGNPLYITSIVDALHRLGENGTSIATQIETAIPPTLADTLAARVALLPLELQGILQDASVLGNDFHAETLMRMLDLSLPRFIELVDRNLSRRHGILRASGTSVVGSRVMHSYQFQPPLMRDAIYRGLSDLERTFAHRRAADALFELHGDTQHGRIDRLARHLERAGRQEEAARAYQRAGEHAGARRDFKTARHLLERAVQLGMRVSDLGTHIRTLISLGLLERGAGAPDAARTHLARALDLASTWHDDTVLASALEAIGLLDFDAGEMARGRDRILRAVGIWAAHDAPDTSRALANLSYILYGLGRYDEAIDSAERARSVATRTRQSSAWIDGTIGLANCWIDLGRYDRAAELHEHALLIGVELGDVHRQRICWINLALIAIERGDWGAAEAALDHVDRGDDPAAGTLEGVLAFHSGLIAEGRGNGALALAHFSHAREIRDRKGQEALAIDAVAGELRVALANDDRERAATLLDDLDRRLVNRGSDGIDGVEHPGRLYETLIEAARAVNRVDRAREHARAAIHFLTERSTHVPDAEREHYLSGVASHHRILELGAELSIIAG